MRVRFFFRPAGALVSFEPGGGQGNLTTHAVAQDCMFCLIFFAMHVILFSLWYAFSARHLPPPRGAVGYATFPFRVGFRLFVSPPRHDGSLRGGLMLVSLVVAPVFFNLPFLVTSPLPR